MDPETIRNQMKHKKMKPKKKSKKELGDFKHIIIKLFVAIILTVGILIGLKKSDALKKIFYQQVYGTHFSFASVNSFYKKWFGNPIPFSDLIKEPVQATFQEKLIFQKQEKYKEGVKLTVDSKYLVPIKNSGLVVFIGEKEGYGKTVIIQQMNGIDLWYGGLSEVNVNLYDYVEEGNLLGETKENYLYLIFKKEGTILDYQPYLS